MCPLVMRMEPDSIASPVMLCRLQPRNQAMNTRFEAPVREAETVADCCEPVGVDRKANRRPSNQGRFKSLWLKAAVRTLEFRRDGLERMHWRKVWRSMVED